MYNEDRQVLANLYDEARAEAKTQRERAVIAETRLHHRAPAGPLTPAGLEVTATLAMQRCHYADESLRTAFLNGVEAVLDVLDHDARLTIPPATGGT